MTKIERRRKVVQLQHGNYEAELEDLERRALAALREEVTGGTRRQGTRSKAMALGKEYDDKLAEADETAVEVTVWAIEHLEWAALADEHPPRDDNDEDAKRGLNMKTFPLALLQCSLVAPEESSKLDTVSELLVAGKVKLSELSLSRVHYLKLETAAWNVNVGDDALPKSSLVSQLQELRDHVSKPQPASE